MIPNTLAILRIYLYVKNMDVVITLVRFGGQSFKVFKASQSTEQSEVPVHVGYIEMIHHC